MLPTLLQIGSFRLPTFGLLVAFAFLAAILWTARTARQRGFDPELIYNLGVWVMISGLLGARLLYVALEWPEYRNNLLSIIMPPYEGLVYYGGFLSSFMAGFIYLKWHKISPWEIGDMIAPAIALGQAIGRWGCFLNGCCFGCPAPAGLLWGMTYPENAPATFMYGKMPVHPIQIYESLGALLIFLFLIRLLNRRAFPGQVIWVYFLSYGVLRFLLEFLRGDDRGFMWMSLSISQWISLIIFPIAFLMLVRGKNQIKKLKS